MNGSERFFGGDVVKRNGPECVCVWGGGVGGLEGLLQRSERQNQNGTGPDSHLSFIIQWGGGGGVG